MSKHHKPLVQGAEASLTTQTGIQSRRPAPASCTSVLHQRAAQVAKRAVGVIHIRVFCYSVSAWTRVDLYPAL